MRGIMNIVGVNEAKRQFSKILLKVIHGETIIITKHGENIAMLVPINSAKIRRKDVQASIDAIRSLRENVTLGKKLTVNALKGNRHAP